MWNKNRIKVVLIRHGKTELNEKHCYIGTTDDPLSDNGINELLVKKQNGQYETIVPKFVFVSPMKRAMQTAALIYSDATFIEIDDFKEMDFGSFEGKNYDQLKDNMMYRKWIDINRGASEDEINDLYAGINFEEYLETVLPENKTEFVNRSVNGFNSVLNTIEKLNAEDNKIDSVSIVAHGGTIMSILSNYCSDNMYNHMVSCGDGIETEVEYTNDDGNITISRFSINNRICS